MGLIRFIQDYDRNKELKAIRELNKQYHREYHSSVEEKCQMCGKPKGFQQFYLVTEGSKGFNICEQCAEKIEDYEHRLHQIKKKIQGWRKQGYNVDELDQALRMIQTFIIQK